MSGVDAAEGPLNRIESTADVEVSSRGRTSITDIVVEKTAAQVALEVDHVHGITRPRIARTFSAGEAVETEVSIDGHLAQLVMRIEVDYPVSVRQVTRQVRQHVRDRVAQLCELTVTDVDIHVTALRFDTRPARRVQ